MKQIILFFLLGVLLTGSMSGQTPSQTVELVYIRIQEPFKLVSGAAAEAIMVVIKPDNSIERIDLKKPGLGGGSLDDNGVIIKNEIAKWLLKGYRIVTNNSSGGDSVLRTEILLIKTNNPD